jgi:sphinganine-1-phosphate aldolase
MSAKSEANLQGLLNRSLAGCQPSTIVLGTTAVVVSAYSLAILLEGGDLIGRLNRFKWRCVRRVAAPLINKEIAKAGEAIKFKVDDGDMHMYQLPQEGMSNEKVLELCRKRKAFYDSDYSTGGLSGTVYHGGAAHTELVNRAMEMYQWSNPLHVDVFGAVRKMEAEIVEMVLDIYNAKCKNGDACGAVTSGGSESIAMAMKASREWGRVEKGLTTFSIVAPVTCHPAFDKAANYFDMELIKVPINQELGEVDPELLAKYIRHDTVVVVGSACAFPNGRVENIPAIAAIAKKHGVLCHVDACLGSFVVPLLGEAGFPVQYPMDFTVDGVTSISCDTHKYGAAPKGTSVVMYHSKSLRRHQFFTIADWPGGNYGSPAAAGSKPGNAIAGTWAAMLSIGRKGYVENARKIMTACHKIRDGINSTESLYVIGQPTGPVVAFSSNRIDVYDLSKKLQSRGWFLNPLQYPSGLQFSVTLLQSHEGVAERFIGDLRHFTTELLAELAPGEAKDMSKGSSLYGSQQRVADRTIIRDVVGCFLDKYYEVK